MVSSGVAHWFLDVAKEVVQFMSLNVDWDSYGGDAVDRATAEAALRVLVGMNQAGLPRPNVFAEGGWRRWIRVFLTVVLS